MNILFAAGIYPPDVGGPALYAYSLKREFENMGNTVEVASFSGLRMFPSGLRHFLYFIKILRKIPTADVVLAFDALSVGLPALALSKFFRKKIFVRLGGDFLWEQYIERTKTPVLLSQFYAEGRKLTIKEKIIFWLVRFVVCRVDYVVFSTAWLQNIFVSAYGIKEEKSFVVENAIEFRNTPTGYSEKVFLWAGRDIFLKNVDMLKRAFADAQEEDAKIRLECVTNLPQDALFQKIKDCYAVIYPSISEVSPNFVLEALSFGKPAIVTRDTGYRDTLKDVALFVDPRNESDIKEKILWLAQEENYKSLQEKIPALGLHQTYSDIASEFLASFKK